MVYNTNDIKKGGRFLTPLIQKMVPGDLVFLYFKYAFALVVVTTIILAPAWLARQTKKNKTITVWVRVYSWLLGWTGIGWLVALYIAVKK